MQFEVKNRWTGKVQFTAEIEADETTPVSIKLGLAVKWAIETRANLACADLSGSDLSEADLSGSDLTCADLSGSDLVCADLSGSDLVCADLSWANLVCANLTWAGLDRADLSGADLSGADLSGAGLYGANLARASLARAKLEEVKDDFFKRLLLAKSEVANLYGYLMRGRIDGAVYEGDCACFCGTVAKVRHETYDQMSNGLEPDVSSPTERWFLAIRQGDTPDNNQVSAITAGWLREFMREHGIAFPEYRFVSSDEFPDAFKV